MWSFFIFIFEERERNQLINYKKSPNKSIQTDIFTTPKNFLAERCVGWSEMGFVGKGLNSHLLHGRKNLMSIITHEAKPTLIMTPRSLHAHIAYRKLHHVIFV